MVRSMSPVPLERPLRRDALRNRARLTDVAAAAFRGEGLDVGVDELARRAGVGIATLYRHFPAKADLIQAVMDLVLDELEAAAATAVRAEPDEIVARFLDAAMGLQCRNRGFLEALAQHDLPPGVRERIRRRTRDILRPVLAAGHAAGTVAPEVDASDLLVYIRMLGAVSSVPAGRGRGLYLATLLRGLAG